MDYRLIALVILTLLCAPTSQEDCNSTHYEFFSKYSIGKQDELNKTFTQLEPNLNVNNVSYRFSESIYYNITNIKVKLFYRDSTQKAEIAGRDTIFIYGGLLHLKVDFSWVKITPLIHTSGTA